MIPAGIITRSAVDSQSVIPLAVTDDTTYALHIYFTEWYRQ